MKAHDLLSAIREQVFTNEMLYTIGLGSNNVDEDDDIIFTEDIDHEFDNLIGYSLSNSELIEKKIKNFKQPIKTKFVSKE
jgi:hypothetical protein